MLIAARALLGVAGATLAPSTLSLIRNMFPDPRERTVAIGVWIASFSAGARHRPAGRRRAARALLVGLGVPDRRAGDGAAARGRAACCCPSTATRTPAGWTSPARRCRSLAVLAVIYGLKRIAEDGLGWLPRRSRSSPGVGDRASLFVRRQRRLADPLIDLRAVPDAARSAPSLATNMLGVLRGFGVVRLHRPVPAARARAARRSRRACGSLPSALGFIVGVDAGAGAARAGSARPT